MINFKSWFKVYFKLEFQFQFIGKAAITEYKYWKTLHDCVRLLLPI